MVIAEKRDIESLYSQGTLDKIPGFGEKNARISLYAKRFEMGAADAVALRENVNRSIHNHGDLDDFKSVNDIDMDEIADRIEELQQTVKSLETAENEELFKIVSYKR